MKYRQNHFLLEEWLGTYALAHCLMQGADGHTCGTIDTLQELVIRNAVPTCLILHACILHVCHVARANSQIGSYHIRQMRDSVRRIIRNMNIAAWKQSLQKSLERDRIDTLTVTTNKAHDKIEMVVSRDEDGDVNSRYLKRVKD